MASAGQAVQAELCERAGPELARAPDPRDRAAAAVAPAAGGRRRPGHPNLMHGCKYSDYIDIYMNHVLYISYKERFSRLTRRYSCCRRAVPAAHAGDLSPLCSGAAQRLL